ncbi:HI_0552 family protein [Streptococcus hyovaginalis]|uniref:HI_0552 family protein n=1 Tax=Streptococcus hyovaginalis TaxID=149015 RepID=UPI002A915A0A|nr:HI_0552 family protein [Streptococcus hyovaginalis]MDY5974697.1 HI_0552 family protein [Streptococcus hyovaginalis]
MFSDINNYLACQGLKYVKPEKAGAEADAMMAFKAQGQAARAEMTTLSKALSQALPGFKMDRVSNWANQAQIGRPHFWTYFHDIDDDYDEVGLAIRLYGQKDNFGISVEVSFIERKKSAETLAKQAKVLDVPITELLYYWVQENGESHREEGTESNRLKLLSELADGKIRKVLVKKDIPMTKVMTIQELVPKLLEAFRDLFPYYEATKK